MNRFDLIKTDNTIYRVLAIKEKILVIDCIRRKMPFWVEKLSGTPTTEQDLQTETGINLQDIDDLSPNARKIAYEHYVVIASVVAVVDDIPARNAMIELASNQFGLSELPRCISKISNSQHCGKRGYLLNVGSPFLL